MTRLLGGCAPTAETSVGGAVKAGWRSPQGAATPRALPSTLCRPTSRTGRGWRRSLDTPLALAAKRGLGQPASPARASPYRPAPPHLPACREKPEPCAP